MPRAQLKKSCLVHCPLFPSFSTFWNMAFVSITSVTQFSGWPLVIPSSKWGSCEQGAAFKSMTHFRLLEFSPAFNVGALHSLGSSISSFTVAFEAFPSPWNLQFGISDDGGLCLGHLPAESDTAHWGISPLNSPKIYS